MFRLPNWNLLVAFETVARHGSFSRAAVELNVLQPAVSRRVALLEQELGVRLINRLRPAATLTADGQILFRAVTGSMTQVQMAVQQIQRAPPEHTLTVNTTIGFANCFLMRRLNLFRELHPETVIELISRDTNDTYNLKTCDIVTVFGSAEKLPGVVQSRIFEERMIAVCAPVYLENNALIDGDFSGHRLLHLPVDIHAEDWRVFLDSLGQSTPFVGFRATLHQFHGLPASSDQWRRNRNRLEFFTWRSFGVRPAGQNNRSRTNDRTRGTIVASRNAARAGRNPRGSPNGVGRWLVEKD